MVVLYRVMLCSWVHCQLLDRSLVMSYCVGFLSGFSNWSFNIISVVISIQYYSIAVGLILMPGIGVSKMSESQPSAGCFGEECRWIHNSR